MTILIDQRNLFVVTNLPSMMEIRDSLFPSRKDLITKPALGFDVKVNRPNGVIEVRAVITPTGVNGMNQDSDGVFCLEGDLIRGSDAIRIKDAPANDAIHVVIRCDLENDESSAMFSIIEEYPPDDPKSQLAAHPASVQIGRTGPHDTGAFSRPKIGIY